MMTTDQIEPGSRWASKSRQHGGEVVEVLRASVTTVKFRVVRGASNHRQQEYAVPVWRFLSGHERL